MLYYDFRDYEEFKERFGIQKHGNGEKSRKNRILLSYIKSKKLLHDAITSGDYYMLHITNMSQLKQCVWYALEKGSTSLPYKVKLLGKVLHSSQYSTDECEGVCADGDTRAVRYINHKNGERVFKMKAGKFLRTLILENDFGKTLPESVITYLMEEFVQDWQVHCMQTLPDNHLFVNEEFSRIYNSSSYAQGNFHSCMTDECNHTFYMNSVEAQAAYLEDDEGMIIARCIIFTNVHEEGSDRIWRLAERQYSADSNDVLKRALIDALIREGYIDGYKQIGAGCGDSRAFVDNSGKSLSNKRFSIDCKLEYDDAVSYQDSFKYYNYYEDKAYNHECHSYDYDLSTTEGRLETEDEEEYDDYHGYYCSQTTAVYVHGREMYCNTNDLADFNWVEKYAEYHHCDDCEFCEDTGDYHLKDDCYYSEIIDAFYSTEKELAKAEQKYKEGHWTYSKFDDEYYEYEEDLTSYLRWNKTTLQYEEESIYVGTLINLVRNGVLHPYGGSVYNMLRHGMPISNNLN